LTLIGVAAIDESAEPPKPYTSTIAQTSRDLGIAVFGGGVVGGVFAAVQWITEEERSRRDAVRDQGLALALTLSTQRDLTGIDLQGLNLDDRYLAGKDFSDARLGDTQMRRVNLGQAKLIRADLTGANLQGAVLMGADLTDADLTGANLTGANLKATTFENVGYDDSTTWPADFSPPMLPRTSSTA
jgi:hypothetical protein